MNIQNLPDVSNVRTENQFCQQYYILGHFMSDFLNSAKY
jgi:hypothetical protein